MVTFVTNEDTSVFESLFNCGLLNEDFSETFYTLTSLLNVQYCAITLRTGYFLNSVFSIAFCGRNIS